MKNKLVFASGMAAGYVLGTRAGRESYEKIRTRATELWNSPKVQSTVSSATETVKDKAPAVQEKVSGVLKKRSGSGSNGKGSGTDTPYDGTPVAVVPPPLTDEELTGMGVDDPTMVDPIPTLADDPNSRPPRS
jgi:hypothetical protein